MFFKTSRSVHFNCNSLCCTNHSFHHFLDYRQLITKKNNCDTKEREYRDGILLSYLLRNTCCLFARFVLWTIPSNTSSTPLPCQFYCKYHCRSTETNRTFILSAYSLVFEGIICFSEKLTSPNLLIMHFIKH